MIRAYSVLMKPGIVLGNLITMGAGFFIHAPKPFSMSLFLFTFLGLAGVIASACIFNNYIDRKVDALMLRTKQRPLVTQIISEQEALTLGTTLALLSFLMLILFTNTLATLTALFGFVFYVLVYSFYKYKSSYGTLVGTLSGATPPLVGYLAATNQFDLGALLLYLMLVFWQMPHFLAIAIYRKEDYRRANIPLLPLTKGIFRTQIEMLIYTILFGVTLLILLFSLSASLQFMILGALLSLAWIFFNFRGFFEKNEILWARQSFQLSLWIIFILSVGFICHGL